MSQDRLFSEDINDALRDVVRALGGAKEVGRRMRPELTIEAASQWVNDCLNPDRRHRFDPQQVVWLIREGRGVGCHSAIHFICDDAGYARAMPIEPLDEAGEIQRQITAAAKVLEQATRRLERIQVTVKAVA